MKCFITKRLFLCRINDEWWISRAWGKHLKWRVVRSSLLKWTPKLETLHFELITRIFSSSTDLISFSILSSFLKLRASFVCGSARLSPVIGPCIIPIKLDYVRSYKEKQKPSSERRHGKSFLFCSIFLAVFKNTSSRKGIQFSGSFWALTKYFVKARRKKSLRDEK